MTYIDRCRASRYQCAMEWRDYTRRRFIWLYGEAGLAKAAGTDPATAADLATWRALGRRAA